MSNINLRPEQIDAIKSLKNGNVLVGSVGSGKSRTSLAYYYFLVCNGKLKVNGNGESQHMKKPRDLYIITTARKRDSKEWEEELASFGLMADNSEYNESHVNVHIDSWNNIKKYQNIYGAFFIFDEQRVVGYGAWTKAFLKISNKNQWILLSATPGDTWSEYMPLFIANHFYKNKTDFNSQHVVFSRFSKYPKIERYINTGLLIRHRNDILVVMQKSAETIRAKQNHISVPVDFDKQLYLLVSKERWDPYDNCPIAETGKLCYLMRKVVNSNYTRISAVKDILNKKHKAIIFYNYDYELDALRELLDNMDYPYSEWNGQKHQEVLTGDNWAYLVQYSAGAEAWNCITTDTMIFYSQNYSYKINIQAAGRIDRLNTPYKELYYYHLKSSAPIDKAISRAISQKKDFNEKSFIGK